MKTFEIEHKVSFDVEDKRTWEKRIDNCIITRDKAEDKDFQVIWNQILEENIRLAKIKTLLIN